MKLTITRIDINLCSSTRHTGDRQVVVFRCCERRTAQARIYRTHITNATAYRVLRAITAVQEAPLVLAGGERQVSTVSV
jgi:hypothetical protein